MLHLDARVHLDEDVATGLGAGGLQQELDRARPGVADFLGEGERCRSEGRTQFGVQLRSRRHLNHLLVPTLDRAIPLEQMQLVAVMVGQHLHLDMPRPEYGLLQVDGAVTEGALGFPHRVTGQPSQILGAIHPPHTATAAASHRLDEHREAQLGGVTRQLGDIGGWRGGLQRGQSSRPGVLDGPHLVAGQPDRPGTGPDENQPCIRAGSREIGILAEEAVPGVDCLGAAVLGDRDDAVDVEVGRHGVTGFADLVGLIRLDAVFRVAVFLGEYRHGAATKFAGRPEGPDCDLAAVGHQDLVEHRSYFLPKWTTTTRPAETRSTSLSPPPVSGRSLAGLRARDIRVRTSLCRLAIASQVIPVLLAAFVTIHRYGTALDSLQIPCCLDMPRSMYEPAMRKTIAPWHTRSPCSCR